MLVVLEWVDPFPVGPGDSTPHALDPAGDGRLGRSGALEGSCGEALRRLGCTPRFHPLTAFPIEVLPIEFLAGLLGEDLEHLEVRGVLLLGGQGAVDGVSALGLAVEFIDEPSHIAEEGLPHTGAGVVLPIQDALELCWPWIPPEGKVELLMGLLDLLGPQLELGLQRLPLAIPHRALQPLLVCIPHLGRHAHPCAQLDLEATPSTQHAHDDLVGVLADRACSVADVHRVIRPMN